MSAIGKNLERFRQAIRGHDELNPTHTPAYGIGMTHFDLERLGFDDGEQLWSGVTIHVDKGCTGNFRVLCHQERTESSATIKEEALA